MSHTHTLSDVKVYVTSNYSMFQRIRGNRMLNKLKIKKMVSDMKQGLNFLADFPLVASVISTKLEIIDGQHRFEAARQLKLPVYYIIRKESLALDKMARLNSLQEKWKPQDFVNCYMEKGVKDYGVLQDFVEEYNVPISRAVQLLYHGINLGNDGSGGEVMRRLFESGEFKAKHLKQAREIMDTCKRFSAFDAWNSSPFVVAIIKILAADKIDFDDLVERVNKNIEMLEHQKNYKDYIYNLEQIYNKGKHKREVIY